MALYKYHYIELDTKRSPRISLQNIVAGETGNRLWITVTNNGETIDMSEKSSGEFLYRVSLRIKSDLGVRRQDSDDPDGGITFIEANTGDHGKINILLSADSFTFGKNRCILEIYSKRVEDDDTLICSAEWTFDAAGNPTGENTGTAYPMMAYYEQLAKSWAVGGTGKREGEDTDNAAFYAQIARDLFNHQVVVPSILAWLAANIDTFKDKLSDDVATWLTANITQPTTPVVDTSLSVSGAAADAKITGIKVNNTDQHNTNYIKPESSEYIAATLADFDPNYRTYEGVQVTSAGAVSTSASYNTYAFVCPYDGFTFKTQMYRIFVATAYPEVGVTLQLKTVIANNESDMTAVRTIATKGDIVILCNPASGNMYLTSPYKNVAKIPNLALSDALDTFKQNAVIDSDVSEIGNDKLNIQIAEGKIITSTTGGLGNNASYDTYFFRVPVNELTVRCTNGFRACLSLTDPTLTQQVANLKQLLYNNSSGRIETFTAHLNDWVVISVGKTAGAIDLQTDYANRFTLPGLRLDWRQQNSFYRYVTEKNAKRLFVYYKSGDKYVRWELHNVPSVNSNSDTWQIGAVYGYDESLITGVELVGAGEYELAFKEYGAADYCGGNNHGDEITDDFRLMIDGKTVTLANLDNEYHAFNRIDAIEHATVNRCDTPDEDILKHQKVWTFENGTVKVRQTLEFLEDLLCDFLCCMLAANRSTYQYGVRQGRVGTEVMTSTNYERVVTKGNEMMYLMYGEHATAKVTARCADHTPDASLWINNAAVLNKMYYNYFGQISNTQVASGTVLRWESEYDIAYN